MFCIGLTGNIASGKSTAAKIFANFGIDIIDADNIAKQLTQPHEPAFQEIVSHFGDVVINSEGTLDRRYVRQIIFEHAEEKKWLEQLLHPLIRKNIREQVENTQSIYCIVEIPLLPKRQDYPYIDRILLIECSREEQIIRIMIRDNCSREQAKAILDAQADMAQYKQIADDIISNNGSFTCLKDNVTKLHQTYMQMAKKHIF